MNPLHFFSHQLRAFVKQKQLLESHTFHRFVWWSENKMTEADRKTAQAIHDFQQSDRIQNTSHRMRVFRRRFLEEIQKDIDKHPK
ncbi:hypothetical protein H4R35_005328 [Dimargaris xerosporica]|nr:hypothetical protein H4R35_005328 [Dimargaris xerosporica]